MVLRPLLELDDEDETERLDEVDDWKELVDEEVSKVDGDWERLTDDCVELTDDSEAVDEVTPVGGGLKDVLGNGELPVKPLLEVSIVEEKTEELETPPSEV